MGAIAVVRPGLFTTIQDLGRWGLQARGVPVAGAMDPVSHRCANALVGNPDDAATLEVTIVGPELRFEDEAVFAVTGAQFDVMVNDVAVEMNRVVSVPAGSLLKFGTRHRGARSYIAVDGGIDVPHVLGSRSTHVLTRMGGYEGRSLRAGDRVMIGATRGDQVRRGATRCDQVRPDASGKGEEAQLPDRGAKLRVIAVDAALMASVVSGRYRISPQSNRMGYRLEGPPVSVPSTGALITTGIPTGCIQIPPDGQPILLMNDHATTGGYAIAGTVITADLPIAGQLQPGDWIEFAMSTLSEADAALRKQEARFAAG
jgi:antagonist of KipI